MNGSLPAGSSGTLAGSFVSKLFTIGGTSKEQLLAQLATSKIELNEAARILLASDRFITSPTPQISITIEAAVHDFGFTQPVTMTQLSLRAAALGFCPPPIELGPHLRLQNLDQPEGYWGYAVTANRAPPGSITVASEPLSNDDQFPKGFYLRRIQGKLWLRGYWASADNLLYPEDRLVFCKPGPLG